MNVIVKVNIACALRWGVASVGITLLGMAHPIWDKILGAEMRRWAVLIRSSESEESRLLAL